MHPEVGKKTGIYQCKGMGHPPTISLAVLSKCFFAQWDQLYINSVGSRLLLYFILVWPDIQNASFDHPELQNASSGHPDPDPGTDPTELM